MKDILLGILGGLGPMSGIYFCEMLTAHTDAQNDGEHINLLLSSRADTPDRTAFILGQSHEDPSPVMAREAKRLQEAGAELLAIPCNTAHYFYEKICSAVTIPVINIIEETALFCAYERVSRVSVLATEGTSASGAYAQIFSKVGIEIEPLTSEEQALLTKIIYHEIKSGKEPDINAFNSLCEALTARGAQRLILGCTELSLIKKSYPLPPHITDSLELLALAAISSCGKRPRGFSKPLMNYYEKGQAQNICY